MVRWPSFAETRLSQQDTLDDLQRVRKDIERLKAPNGQHVPMVIVGSEPPVPCSQPLPGKRSHPDKADLEIYREVKSDDGYKLAQDAACEYIETSAVSERE